MRMAIPRAESWENAGKHQGKRRQTGMKWKGLRHARSCSGYRPSVASSGRAPCWKLQSQDECEGTGNTGHSTDSSSTCNTCSSSRLEVLTTGETQASPAVNPEQVWSQCDTCPYKSLKPYYEGNCAHCSAQQTLRWFQPEAILRKVLFLGTKLL